MGLFSKKKHGEKTPSLPRLPELPTLPGLQNFPDSEDEYSKELHQLPSFPTSEFGEKFSQDIIKNAVEGDERENLEIPENPLIAKSIEMEPQIQKTNPPENFSENYDLNMPAIPSSTMKQTTPNYQKKIISAEPIFIRIDKFEESLKIFGESKEKIKEIENLLKETKELKLKEDKELSLWEIEIQELKKQIEHVDKDIFSKIQ